MPRPASSTAVRRLLLWGPVLAYMAAIFYVSSLSHPPLPPRLGDKFAHAFGYAGLGLLLLRAVAGGRLDRVRGATWIAAVVLATLYGVSDEFHQSFVPGRDADVRDVLADATGAAIGSAVAWAWGIIGPVLTRFHTR